MTEALSNEQVAQLVEAAKFGGDARVVVERPERRKKPRRIREIDFSRPTKFTKEQEKRLEREHEAFCRATANRLTTELRAEIEFEVIAVSQYTLAAAIAEMPSGTLYGVLVLEPLGTPILLAMETGMVLAMMERILGAGGEPTKTSGDHELTDIERSLARRMFALFVDELATVWNDLFGVAVRLDRLESQLMNVQLAPPSEPTLGIAIEHRWAELSATLSLIVPYRSIEEVVSRLPSSQSDIQMDRREDSEAARSARALLGGVELEFRVEIGSIEIPLERVVSLREGEIVSLGKPAAAGVTVFAGGIPTHVAKPGRRGQHRAVEIVGRST